MNWRWRLDSHAALYQGRHRREAPALRDRPYGSAQAFIRSPRTSFGCRPLVGLRVYADQQTTSPAPALESVVEVAPSPDTRPFGPLRTVTRTGRASPVPAGVVGGVLGYHRLKVSPFSRIPSDYPLLGRSPGLCGESCPGSRRLWITPVLGVPFPTARHATTRKPYLSPPGAPLKHW